MTNIELTIGGMTCASCAARIEKKLNRVAGVTASVNYATDKATIEYAAEVTPQQLVDVVEATGYTAGLPAAPVAPDGSATPAVPVPDEADALQQRLLICVVLALPVLVLSMVPALQFTSWQWLALTLASPVVVWGALPFHRATWVNARHGAATMDTLISVGVGAAYLWSLWALFFGRAGEPGMRMDVRLFASGGSGSDAIYLEIASVVTVFILAGRLFEARAKQRAGSALRALLTLGAKDVAVLRGPADQRVESLIPIAQLAVGDHFVVRPGDKVATDGTVLEGTSAIDASMLTGESVPAEVGPGDVVVGATVNSGGRLVVRADRVGSDTALAQLARLVEQAQSGKAEVQRLADRVAGVFVPVVIVLSLLTLAAWLATGHPAQQAFTAAVAVLIIACPCALGLATPTALLVGTGRGAQLGIVIKGPQVLESTRAVDTIVLDKTGTVTSGRMSVHDVLVEDGVDSAELLRVAGSIEHASEHPIARAIVAAADGLLGSAADFASAEGLGVTGTVAGRDVCVGRLGFVQSQGFGRPTPGLAEQAAAAARQGRSVVVVGWDGQVRGAVVVADTVKPTSAEAVRALRALGLNPVLLTGDNEPTARAVADEVGIDEVVADVLPADKVAVVRRLQSAGHVVAMVGDGVNDAAALTQADLGLAMGTGTDVAIEASDLTLVSGDLLSAVDAIRLSRATLRTIKGNLFWAFAYNVAAIPLAALGLLNPLIAGAAMAFSSVFVLSNSLRLRRFRSDFH